MSGCTVSDDAAWASNVQQAASVTLMIFVIVGAAAFYYFRPKGVAVPRYELSLYPYLGAIIGEAVAIGFGLAYVFHLRARWSEGPAPEAAPRLGHCMRPGRLRAAPTL